MDEQSYNTQIPIENTVGKDAVYGLYIRQYHMKYTKVWFNE